MLLPETIRALGAAEIESIQKSGAVVSELISHPLLAACLTMTLQTELEKGKSFKGNSEAAIACCRLLAYISGASNAASEWSMSVLLNAGSAFEELFDAEIHHDSCSLHVDVLGILLDHNGKRFTGRDMWELTNGHIDRSLVVLSAFLKANTGDDTQCVCARVSRWCVCVRARVCGRV